MPRAASLIQIIRCLRAAVATRHRLLISAANGQRKRLRHLPAIRGLCSLFFFGFVCVAMYHKGYHMLTRTRTRTRTRRLWVLLAVCVGVAGVVAVYASTNATSAAFKLPSASRSAFSAASLLLQQFSA